MRLSVILALFGTIAGVQASQKADPTPLDRVVSLISQMQAKITADGDTEQKVYDKYACWCENTLKRKANAIDKDRSDIAHYQQVILTTKGRLATLEDELKVLDRDIAENKQAQKDATALREKERTAFLKEKAEYEEAIDALGRAINVLNGSGTEKKAQALVEGAVRKALALGRGVSADVRKAANAFLAQPDFHGATASFNGHYNSQSTTIQGIIKQMHETFTANLQASTDSENTKQSAFDGFMASKTHELELQQQSYTEKTAEHGEKSVLLADSQALLRDTTELLGKTEKFFHDTSKGCKDKADVWSERSRLRTEELTGIRKALAFLSSDEGRSIMQKSRQAFVQISNVAMKAAAVDSAKEIMRDIAKTAGRRLPKVVALAMSQQGGEAAFEDVIKAIEGMEGLLHEEEKGDIKQKDWCTGELNDKNNKADDHAYMIQKLGNAIGDLQRYRAETVAELEATKKAIQETEKMLEEAAKRRSADEAAYKQAKSDDEDAIALLKKTIETLATYFKNNNIPVPGAFIATASHPHKAAEKLAHEAPKFEVSPDQAPVAEFSKAENAGGSAGTILTLLGHLQANLERDIELADKSEALAKTEYARVKADGESTIVSLNQKATELNGAIASTDEAIEGKTSDKKYEEDGKSKTEAYLQSIHPNCQFILQAFDERDKKRKAELTGLQQAKAILRGAVGEYDYGLASTTEEPAWYDKEKAHALIQKQDPEVSHDGGAAPAPVETHQDAAPVDVAHHEAPAATVTAAPETTAAPADNHEYDILGLKKGNDAWKTAEATLPPITDIPTQTPVPATPAHDAPVTVAHEHEIAAHAVEQVGTVTVGAPGPHMAAAEPVSMLRGKVVRAHKF